MKKTEVNEIRLVSCADEQGMQGGGEDLRVVTRASVSGSRRDVSEERALD